MISIGWGTRPPGKSRGIYGWIEDLFYLAIDLVTDDPPGPPSG